MTTKLHQLHRNRLVHLVTGLAGALLIGGCTQTAKDEYNDAGTHIQAAVKDTGAAIKADATHAKEAAQDVLAKNDLASKIRKGIQDRPELKVTDLAVDVSGSTVTLKGTIPTEVLNQRTEHLARHLAGPGYQVEDQISVSGG